MRLQVAEQFHDAHQQHEAAIAGMWVFILTEVMIFGTLFTAYTVYRAGAPEAFQEGSHHLYESIGATNTAILLLSSVTMAISVRCADAGRRGLTFWLLIATAFLGCCFLGLKGLEYYLDYSDSILPRWNFAPAKGGPHVELFITFYWIATCLHALHLTIAVCVVLGFAALIHRRGTVKPHSNQISAAGLYWHFVDIVWIFLFPLLYMAK